MPEIKQLNIADDIIPALDQSLSANTYHYTNGVLYVEAQDTQLYNVREFTVGRFHGVIFDVTYPYSGPSLRVQLHAPGDELTVTVTVDDGSCSVTSGWVGDNGQYGSRTDTKTGGYRYVRVSRNRYLIEGFTGGNDYIFVDVSHDKQSWEPMSMTGEMANPGTLDDNGWLWFFEFNGNVNLGPILGVDVPPYALPGDFDFKLRTAATTWLSVANAEHPLKLRMPDDTWAVFNNREKVPGPKLYLRQDSTWLFVSSAQPVGPKTVTLRGKITINGVALGNDFVQIGPYKGVYRTVADNSNGDYRISFDVDALPADIPINMHPYYYGTDQTDTIHFTTAQSTVTKNFTVTDANQTRPSTRSLVVPYPTAWRAARFSGSIPTETSAAVDQSADKITASGTYANSTGVYSDQVRWIAIPLAAYRERVLYDLSLSNPGHLSLAAIQVTISLYGNSAPENDPNEFTSTPVITPGGTGHVYYQGPINSPVDTWTYHDNAYPSYEDHTKDSPYPYVTGKTFAKETTGTQLYSGPLNNLAWTFSNNIARPSYDLRHDIPVDFAGQGLLYHTFTDQATPGVNGFNNSMAATFTVDFYFNQG